MSCGKQKNADLEFREGLEQPVTMINQMTHIFILVDDINSAGLILVHGTTMQWSPNGDIV